MILTLACIFVLLSLDITIMYRVHTFGQEKAVRVKKRRIIYSPDWLEPSSLMFSDDNKVIEP